MPRKPWHRVRFAFRFNGLLELMGMFEKRRFRKMVMFTDSVNEQQPQTWEGLPLDKCPMQAVFEKFGVDNNTQVRSWSAITSQIEKDWLILHFNF